MTILAGLFICYIAAYFIGKNTAKMTFSAYVGLAVLTLAQVLFVMYELSTTEFPRP